MHQTTHPTYLVHFNKNHDSKNGQFTYGDGDGDGVSDDHKNQKKTKTIMGNPSDFKKNPIKNPYKYSSAANKPKSSKLSKSSMFKSSDFSEYFDENGRVDNAAYTKSGIKKFLAGAGLFTVGRVLQTSDNVVAEGAGFVADVMGMFYMGYGAGQTFIGVSNQIYNKKHPDRKYD